MRAVKVATVVMGVLIVAGLAVIAAAITGRMSGGGGTMASILLEEPPGTRIAGSSLLPDRIAVTLQGGGPADRIVVLDLRNGRVLSRVALR